MQDIYLNALLFVLLLSFTMLDWTEAAVGRCMMAADDHLQSFQNFEELKN